MAECIHYGEGYKYQLRRTYETFIEIRPDEPIRTAFIDLDPDGWLTIRAGYAWDGPSGITFDTLDFMRGSLVHDALYQLMREGFLDRVKCREPADNILTRMTKEDGMWAPRRAWVYAAVRTFGDPCADPASISPDKCAPAACNETEAP